MANNNLLSLLEDKLTEELINKAQPELAKRAGYDMEKMKKNYVNLLDRKFKQLDEVLTKEERAEEVIQSAWWWRDVAGFEDVHANDRHVSNYQLAFRLVNEIASMLRMEPEIILRVQNETQKGTFVYELSESKMKTGIRERENESGKKIRELYYKLDDIKKDSERTGKVQKAFQEHYQIFSNYLITYQRKINTRYNFNEGNIIEAYYSHIAQRHSGESFYKNFSRNDEQDSDFHRDALINLYYAINNAGWWTGGDIDNFQIKGENRRLASLISIRMAANELMYLYQSLGKIDAAEWWRKFEKGFKAEQKKEMNKQRVIETFGEEVSESINNFLNIKT